MIYFINFLSLSRIISGPIIFLIITLGLLDNYYAIFIFALAAFTDYIDGHLARKYNLVTPFGEIIDPISDKILTIFLLFTLTLYTNSFLIAFCSSMIITREVWVSALRDYNSRYGNISATKVSFLAKLKTSLQFFTIFFYLICISYDINNILFLLADLMFLITASITIYTGIIYTLNTFNIKK